MFTRVLRKHLDILRKVTQNEQKRNYAAYEKLVETREENGIKYLTMNNPKTRNALSIPIMEELLEGVKAAKESSVRCVVISGNGPVFSSGHNLKELANGKESLYLDTFSKCAELMLSIIEAPVPIIASVNGVAAAAGCQLVATCDIVIATNRSTFSTPGANFGIFCSTPGIALSRCVGRKAAARMLLTGMSVSAEEALQIGLVSRICEEKDLEAEVEIHTSAIKSKSRAVIELGKKFFYQHVEKDISSAYKLGTQVMTNNLLLADGQEGLQSFVEKRKPVWKNDFSKSYK